MTKIDTNQIRFKSNVMMFLIIISFFTFQESIAQTLTYNSGTATWVAPAGVTSVQVETWGAGGNGARRSTNGAGGGGGGGAYSLRSLTVVPGNTYYINVGAGGNGSNSTVVNGGDSWFSATNVVGGALVLSKGGNSVGDSPVGGTGGNYADGIGDIRRSGGSGANSSGSNAGGGGSSAGSGAIGTNATNNFGAVAPSGGANGGNGRLASDNEGSGSAGTAPGGGGGGSYRTANTQNGGDGGLGRVVIKVLGPVLTYDSVGMQEWVAPAGVSSIQVETWGAGGRGGSRTSNNNDTGFGGGGAGGYSSSIVSVTPGQTYYYRVGVGASSTTAGEDSWFSTTNTTTGSLVRAKGGNSVPDNTTTGASGGATTGGTNPAIGTTKTAGGTGTNGGVGQNGGTGGASPNGGTGGTGKSNAGAGNGNTGNNPGGGGGGSYRAGSGSGSPTGGNGGNGQVKIQIISSDIEIVNSVNTTSPLIGDNVTFTLTVKNNGPTNATNIVVTDILPTGFAYVNHSGGTYNNTTGKWTIASLNNAATSVLTIVAAINATGVYTNNAVVTADQSDLNQINNKSASTVFPRERTANLQINKEVNNHIPLIGGTIIFTITAYNSGPENATGVVVQDILPFGFAYQSHTGGTFLNGEWTVGNLSKGSVQTLTITAVVQPTGNYYNNASIHGNEIDPVVSNNTAGVIINPTYPTKVITLQCLDGVTYDLNPLLTGIAIPSGATPSWHIATPATFGNIYAGSTTSAPAGTYYVAFYDTVAGCYSKTIPVQVNSIACKTDLQIVKTVSNPKPKVGSMVTFTLTITNNGPDDATGVLIEDVVPNGYTAITNISNSGNLAGNTLTWSGLSINNAQTQILTFEAKVKAPGIGTSHDNTASVANSDQQDPDLTNNEDSIGTDPAKSLLVTNPMIHQKTK